MADALYSREQVDHWQGKLESIAQLPRTTFTKKQAVEALIDAIELALETRSYDEVASALEAEGLDISAGSLKQYVSKYRKAHPVKPDSGKRKRSTKAVASSPSLDEPEKADGGSKKRTSGKGVKQASEKHSAVRASLKASSNYDDAFLEMAEDL